MTDLNDRLGSGGRVPGGVLTCHDDDDPCGTQASLLPGLTEVKVLDHEIARNINFEASIDYPEPMGIVQIENL